MKMKENRYRFIFFDETDTVQSEDMLILLRHDVDLSVEYAYQLAEIEYEHQIQATYFFMVSSPFYNICEPVHRQMLQEMLQMGHRIGLHYNPSPKYDTSLDTSIQQEAQLLSSVIGSKVNVFSYHRPSLTTLNQPLELSLINAYSPEYLNHFKYVSDSNHTWKEGCLTEHLQHHNRLYILIHPIWWVYQDNKQPIEKIYEFLGSLSFKHHKELMDNIKGYKNYLLTSKWKSAPVSGRTMSDSKVVNG